MGLLLLFSDELISVFEISQFELLIWSELVDRTHRNKAL